MSAWNGVYDDNHEDPHHPCSGCGEEHPVNVLDDGLCPSCGDSEDDEMFCDTPGWFDDHYEPSN